MFDNLIKEQWDGFWDIDRINIVTDFINEQFNINNQFEIVLKILDNAIKEYEIQTITNYNNNDINNYKMYNKKYYKLLEIYEKLEKF